MPKYVDAVFIRKKFEHKLSEIYINEVIKYKEMLQYVVKINKLVRSDLNCEPLVQEHHGAIRVGTGKELAVMRRLFAVMAMLPVNYYDLSVAGLPVHSTAFRDITKAGLSQNSFRVFVSLLRLDLVNDKLKNKVEDILSKRKIVNDKTLNLIEKFENQSGLTEYEAEEFVNEATKTFSRVKRATVSKEFYDELLKENSLLADIVAFATPHLNHLTPKTDDIDLLFDKLHEAGVQTTPIIQGPPKRNVPILLRQMSFQAVMEEFEFPDDRGNFTTHGHRARFGEYETKNDAAVTKKGRKLYDKLLNKTLAQTNDKDPNYKQVLTQVFKEFPDNIQDLRKQGLVYFLYSVNEEKLNNLGLISQKFEELIDAGIIEYTPVHYHDFLPVSAAGIFKSNLVEGGFIDSKNFESKQVEFEEALGCKITDSFALYAKQESDSIKDVLNRLKIDCNS